MSRLVLGLLALCGCQRDLDELDGAFYDGDGRKVHCAVNLDSDAGNDLASIDTALDRAAARGEVAELYAHKPGDTVPMATIEHVLAGARDRGLAFVTYADFAAGVSGGGHDATGPGIALSFDDSGVANWIAARPLLQQYGARVTFFVVRYLTMSPERKALVRQLADDGHAIEPHSVSHLRAPEYVEDHGLAAYLADEALPSIDVLRLDGYPVSAYAYPFGARTDEIDDAMLAHIPILRSVSFSVAGVVSPCPR